VINTSATVPVFSGHGRSEKVGWWQCAEEEGSGDEACPLPSYGGAGVSNRNF